MRAFRRPPELKFLVDENQYETYRWIARHSEQTRDPAVVDWTFFDVMISP